MSVLSSVCGSIHPQRSNAMEELKDFAHTWADGSFDSSGLVWNWLCHRTLTSARAAQDDTSRSRSAGRVLCLVAAGLCFIEAATHSEKALKSSAEAIKSNLEMSAKVCSDLLVNASDFLEKASDYVNNTNITVHYDVSVDLRARHNAQDPTSLLCSISA